MDPPSSTNQTPRLQRKQTRFPRRAYKHVNNFIRVQIHLRDGTEFPLTLDVGNSLDYVAKQIEAEATFRNIERLASSDKALDDLSKSIDVYQLYDAADMAIPFSALVKDILKFDDDIYPVTSIEESVQLPTERRHQFLISADSVFNMVPGAPDTSHPQTSASATQQVTAVDESNGSRHSSLEKIVPQNIKDDAVKAENETSAPTQMFIANQSLMNSVNCKLSTISTLVDRLGSVLHNIAALQFFNEYCLQAYSIENVLFWIEAEVFRTITDEKEIDSFSKHIYDAYVKEGAPLELNVDSEIRQAVTMKYEQRDRTVFNDLQAFIFMLLERSVYSRFEESQLFQKFLRFKADDRYGYVQGKTMWEYEGIRKNLKEIQLHSEPDNDSSPSLFRHKVLLDVIERYFPKSLSVPNKYFDVDDRRERIQKRRQIKKQKRLTKFFGGQLGEDALKHQQIETDGVSIHDDKEEPSRIELRLSKASSIRKGHSLSPSLDQKRKKAEKLTEFFGDQLPSREMKMQSQLNGMGYISPEKNPALDDPDADIVGNLNKLTQEERMILQKRARKLLAILGSDSERRAISTSMAMGKNNQNVVPAHYLTSQQEVGTYSDESFSREMNVEEPELAFTHGHSPSSTTIGGNKRKKAEKIVGFFGNQKARDEIQRQLSDNYTPSNPANEDFQSNFDFMGGENELTTEEKLILQRRAKKLLSILGSDLDGRPISPSQIVGDNQNRVNTWFQEKDFDIESSQSSFPSLDEEMNMSPTRLRLDKLSKTLGEKISEIHLQEYSNAEERIVARPLSPLEKKEFKKKNDKLERVFGNVVPAEEVIYYGHIKGSIREKTDNSADNEDEDSASVSAASNNQIEEDKQNQLIRLRKLKKMLGITEGSPIGESGYKEIYEAVNRLVDNENDRKSILEELDKMALSPTQKKTLQWKNQKMEHFFGNTVPQEILSAGGVRMEDNLSASDYPSSEISITDHYSTEENAGFRLKHTVSRLRKLCKMLGINDETGPMTEDAIKAIQEAIMITVEDEEDKRSLLEELYKKSKGRELIQ